MTEWTREPVPVEGDYAIRNAQNKRISPELHRLKPEDEVPDFCERYFQPGVIPAGRRSVPSPGERVEPVEVEPIGEPEPGNDSETDEQRAQREAFEAAQAREAAGGNLGDPEE